MLKKFSHIILTLLMLVSIMGMTVSKHYCGKHLKSIHLTNSHQSCCNELVDYCQDDTINYCQIETTRCCHIETINYKIDNSYSSTDYNFDFTRIPVELSWIIEQFNNKKITAHHFVNYGIIPFPPKILTLLSSLQVFLL